MGLLEQPAGLMYFLPPWPQYYVPITNYPVLIAFVVLGLYCGQCLQTEKCELKNLIR